MTIDEAIINLLTLHKILSKDTDPIFLNSIKLGREALKWRQEVIRAGFKPSPALLPGETKD